MTSFTSHPHRRLSGRKCGESASVAMFSVFPGNGMENQVREQSIVVPQASKSSLSGEL